MRRRPKQQSGFIFVFALIVIAGLVALMVMLAADQRASVQEIQSRMRQRRADIAAQSAIARSLAVLQAANPSLVSLNDDWATLGANGDTAFDLGNATFRMEIVDASSMLNVNTASSQQLLQLPITQEQIDSLLDWRETNLQARADGAKDTYYNALPQPYNTKLGALTTLNELLLVKSWTGQTLYEPMTTVTSTGGTLPTDANGNPLPLVDVLTVDSGAPNTQVDGTARVNLGRAPINGNTLIRLGINGATAQTIISRGPYTSFRTLLAVPGLSDASRRQLLDAATFSNATHLEGKLNINTASQAVLMTIPNMTTDIASAIVAQQSTGFSELGDLVTASSMSPTQIAQFADNFSVGSDTWIVRAYGESGGLGTAIEATVGSRNGVIQTLTVNHLNTTGIPTWWNWDTDTTSTIDAGASQ